MDCRELKTMMESYIGDELLVETNHEVLRHLENCPDCRRDMADRRSLKLQLRHAVKNAEEARIEAAFAMRVTAGLRETALRPSIWDFSNPRIAALSFACIVFVGLGAIVWLNQINFSPNTEEGRNLPATKGNTSDLENAVRVSWDEMTAHAVGDHKNCAVEFHLAEEPISLDEAAVTYGAFNKDLDETVDAALKAVFNGDDSNGIKFLEAHSCIFEGRRFAHIVMRHNGQIVSVLVTDTDLPGGTNEIQTTHFDETLNAAGFHIEHHAVFVVSELPDAENMTIARSLVPAIRLHAEKVGA
jgi:hypothetical protein